MRAAEASLSASKVEQRESERERKAKEALENLMRLFRGVHGRVLDVCKPSARKYNAAVTVAMGKNMEAIVAEVLNLPSTFHQPSINLP